jgi:hypothetical protein
MWMWMSFMPSLNIINTGIFYGRFSVLLCNYSFVSYYYHRYLFVIVHVDVDELCAFTEYHQYRYYCIHYLYIYVFFTFSIISLYICIYTCIYMYIYTYICIYVCMYIYMYIYSLFLIEFSEILSVVFLSYKHSY